MLKSPNVYAFVRVASKLNDRYVFSSGHSIFLDTTLDNAHIKNLACHGTLVSNPSKIDKVGKEENEMPWKTTVETLPGDEVWFNYICTENAFANNKMVEDEHGFVIPVKYSDMYVAKRGEQVICLNGYVLIKPQQDEIVERVKRAGLYLGEREEQLEDKRYGEVAYMGSCNEYYVWDGYSDAFGFEVGDTVVLEKNCRVALEYDTHQHFDGNRYYRVQRKNILGIKTS